MQRGVQSRCLCHGLCDGCGLVRGQIVVEIVVAAVVVAVGSVGAVLHEPGLVVKGRAVHHFRWSLVLLGFSEPCELSATSVGDGVLSSVLSGSVLSGLGFGCIHEVNRENVDDSPFIALGGMAAALAKGASCTHEV